jgi:haloacid dehalogenase superfamily, subfamily IA, variant 3 with third motif having DD or ED
MNKRYAIFDMDGTLVDSMAYWRRLSSEYLNSRGVAQIPQDILERIKPMTMTESAALFLRTFSLSGTPESIAAEMNALMERHYRSDIPLKSGVEDYLRALSADGVRMCVASATSEPLAEACLRRLGVLPRFEFLLSCERVGAGKNRPDVYLAAAKRLGAPAGEIAVYEDALFAADTAKRAGFYVVGVYDESAGRHWDQLSNLADETIRSF